MGIFAQPLSCRAPRRASERAEVGVAEGELRRGDVLLEVGEVAGSRDRQHHRRFLQQPGDGDLRRGDAYPLRERDHFGFFQRGAVAERIPRNEGDAVLLAVEYRKFTRPFPPPAAVTYGQLVLVDVPEALRPWWPRRTPLLKPVAGLPGDILTVRDGHFYVNARDYGPMIAMAAGMLLPQVDSPTIIGPGEVCLASLTLRSLDCRYTGPLPSTALKAMATPFWVWE